LKSKYWKTTIPGTVSQPDCDEIQATCAFWSLTSARNGATTRIAATDEPAHHLTVDRLSASTATTAAWGRTSSTTNMFSTVAATRPSP
jgi:hypothetical protein